MHNTQLCVICETWIRERESASAMEDGNAAVRVRGGNCRRTAAERTKYGFFINASPSSSSSSLSLCVCVCVVKRRGAKRGGR